MRPGSALRLWSIPAGVPFLPALAEALMDGRLVPGFEPGDDPLALADATIYLPTRRAARALRAAFMERLGRRATALPVIRALGEFDEDGAVFDGSGEAPLSLAPPMESLERILSLAPLVERWKKRLPAHVAQIYGEDVVVPTSFTDAVWLARDLAELIDEIETEGADWTRLAELVPEELAGWWQVTLDFLRIVTEYWPNVLAERGLSDPSAHRNATIDAEAERLRRTPPSGPVIAAGSTGSIPATARLLSVIARLPKGAVVLPGLDPALDEESWNVLGAQEVHPASFGHPHGGLCKLLARMEATREDVVQLVRPQPPLAARMRLITDALRPAETTHRWADLRGEVDEAVALGALEGVTLIEARDEREEALSIAIALRLAVENRQSAALVTGDRALARRVATELKRFGIDADDSGGVAIAGTPPAVLLRLAVEALSRTGDPVAVLALLKHPLLRLSRERSKVRSAAEAIELVALRGRAGRVDAASLAVFLADRRAQLAETTRPPFWRGRLDASRLDGAGDIAAALEQALAPLAKLREDGHASLSALALASVEVLEALGRNRSGGLAELYHGDAGERLAGFLRELLAAADETRIAFAEWPDLLAALMAGATVKPAPRGDGRVAIWGTLEARLQSVDLTVLAGLNEGSWPRRPDAGRFMSRGMKTGLAVEPPERRIGQSAHDFFMALGTAGTVLSRAVRAGDAPAVESRWLQRIRTFAGKEAMAPVVARGAELLAYARMLDEGPRVNFVERPAPTPALALRPVDFSITEIETLRRDPYAIFAKRVLALDRLDPLIGAPGPAERGSLFHDALEAFSKAGIDCNAPDAVDRLVEIGRGEFARMALPPEVEAVWWPRFLRMAEEFVAWERGRDRDVVERLAETVAGRTGIGVTGATLRGRADRIDRMADGTAEIIDFKTGSSPSKAQASRLVAPQLALEGALLMRGAFAGLADAPTPSDLVYLRLRHDGEVKAESLIGKEVTADGLSREAWERLEKLIAHYADPETGYLSRALPFRETDMNGPYDHLARAQEWSSAGEKGEEDA